MKHLVAFPMEGGGTIIVEVNDQEELGGSRRAGRTPEGEPERAPQTFEQALSKIRPATEKVIAALSELVQKPNEIEMEFGFSLSADAGVIIASVSTQANYRVTLRWHREIREKAN